MLLDWKKSTNLRALKCHIINYFWSNIRRHPAVNTAGRGMLQTRVIFHCLKGTLPTAEGWERPASAGARRCSSLTD